MTAAGFFYFIIFFYYSSLLKKVVSKILPFRIENNKFLEPIWNRHHIERVEIVLKETLDCKGEQRCNKLLFIEILM